MASHQLRTIWGIAKSQELQLSDEELHLVVQAHTGKDSLKELSQGEVQSIIGILSNMKGTTIKSARERKRSAGNQSTINQRKKVYMLTKELGWEKKQRVNGMCKKMFGVATLEWLDYQQCSKLIECLKKMVERQED